MTSFDEPIRQWRAAAEWEIKHAANPDMGERMAAICEAAARELEIERDTGKRVAINRRTA